jgi:hypothetical protein
MDAYRAALLGSRLMRRRRPDWTARRVEAIEVGRYDPTLTELWELASALGVSIHELVDAFSDEGPDGRRVGSGSR